MGTLCFDLDGTLCTNTYGAYEEAEPIAWAIDRVAELSAAGHRIVVLTARGSATGIDWEPVTRAQLERWGVAFDDLRFGKPSADVYVDDRAVHVDAWRCDDAARPPGFGRRRTGGHALPGVLPPPVTAVVEHGRTYGGAPLRLEAHVDRLLALAAGAGVCARPGARAVVAEALEHLADDAREDDDLVYAISLQDRGHAAFGDAWPSASPALQVTSRPLREAAAGLLAWCTDASGPGALAVRAAYGPGVPAWPLARQHGRALDHLGGTLLVVHDDVATISRPGGPPAVAVRWALEIAAGASIEIAETPVRPGDLDDADEVAVVGMPFCAVALTEVEGRQVGDGTPGPVVRRLLEAWGEAADVDLAAQAATLALRSAVAVP